jgi:hypothetical protein
VPFVFCVGSGIGPNRQARDKFLYGFKGGLAPAAAGRRVAKVGEVARGKTEKARTVWQTWGQPTARDPVVRGRQSPGRLGASPAASRAAAVVPAARSASPNRSARGTRRNDRASWRTHERPAAMSTRATRRPDRIGGKSKAWQLSGLGRNALPKPRRRMVWQSPGTCQERFASLRDGLRPHLTEPVRQAGKATVT